MVRRTRMLYILLYIYGVLHGIVHGIAGAERIYARTWIRGPLMLMVACVLALIGSPSMAHGAARQLHGTLAPLPAGSTVQMFPYYSSHSQFALASVGQGARATINVPLSYQGYAPDGNIDVYIVSLNHEETTCAASAPGLLVVKVPNGDATSIFVDGSFTWPAAATSTAFGSPYYAICLHVEDQSQHTFPDYFSWTLQDGSPGAATDRLFQVVSDAAPTATLSATTVAQGQTLKVTGHNWIPVYGDVSDTQVGANIYQYPAINQRIDYASLPVNVDASGNFAVSFTIPSSYPVGLYYLCVGSVKVEKYCGGSYSGIQFHIVAPASTGGGGSSSPSDTPAPTTTVSPNTLTSPTTSSASTPPSGSGVIGAVTDGGDSGDPPWLLITLAVVVLLGLAGGGTLLLLLQRRRGI